MAHVTYTTDAFVLGGSAVGEANRYIALLTRDLGFVRAVAKSVRNERSKLRYSLQDYTFATVSLVRGKDVWRLTGAQDAHNPVFATGDGEVHALFARLSMLLKRLLQGEEPNAELYAVLEGLCHYVEGRSSGSYSLENAEAVAVMRILYRLGYLAPQKDAVPLVVESGISDDTLAAIEPLRKEVITMINESLSQSQL